MSATLKIGNVEATCAGFRWTSETAGVAEMLNARLALVYPFGPHGDDPNPDATAAEEAAKALGGKVTHADPVERVKGRVY